MSEIIVRVKNWETYNPRSDVKKNSWFRLNHDFFTHPHFYDLSFEERCVWLFILCERSKLMNEKNVPLILDYCHRTIGFDKIVVHRAVEKLKKKQLIDVVTSRGRYADVGLTCSTNVTNERNDTIRTHERNEKGVADEAPLEPSLLPEIATVHKPKSIKKPKTTEPTLGSKIFDSYAFAYLTRWKKSPVRNARINKMAESVGLALGEDGPDVANFYVWHNKAFYVSNCHAFKFLLSDAESLHTQWITGKQVTRTEAQAVENRQQNVNAWSKHLTPEGEPSGN